MKIAAQNLALVAAVLASKACAEIQMYVRYSDNLIDVGSLDAFAATWEEIYAYDGSLQGVITDETYQTDDTTCKTDSDSDLTVQVTMDGSWGAEGNASASIMRAAMVETLWNSLDALWNQSSYTIYSGCSGTTWQDTPNYSADAACGPYATASCADACSDAENPATVQCTTGSSASKLPSKLKVTAYEDGTLLADDLTITFAATENDSTDGGCGLVGTITEKLSSFIPYVGGLFSAGISFECGDS